MINGLHSIIYSANAKADSIFFRDILKLPNVDVGNGWLIFGMPPSELAVHPARGDLAVELYLMCADIQVFVKEMSKAGIHCGEIQDQRWGLLTHLTLPGGGRLGVYEPRHARPKPAKTKTTKASPVKTKKSRI